jgi:phage anti-repressor protein
MYQCTHARYDQKKKTGKLVNLECKRNIDLSCFDEIKKSYNLWSKTRLLNFKEYQQTDYERSQDRTHANKGNKGTGHCLSAESVDQKANQWEKRN